MSHPACISIRAMHTGMEAVLSCLAPFHVYFNERANMAVSLSVNA